jgi:hypothetical protein
MRMAGIHPLNPSPIQSRILHFCSFGPVCGTPITVKRPDPPPLDGSGASDLRRGGHPTGGQDLP